MGLIKADRHDGFISYASRDNAAYGNLIKGIRDDLRTKFDARFPGAPTSEVDFFIDEVGMPANGLPSQELKKDVAAAEFLFIFMSERYVASELCGKELDWFRECFGGDRGQALKRTFVILLEEKAQRQHWGEFLERPERPKFVELFDEEGKPLKRFLQAEGYRAVLNPAYEAKLDWITETMIARAQEVEVALEIKALSEKERTLEQRIERLKKIKSKISLTTFLEIERLVSSMYVLGED